MPNPDINHLLKDRRRAIESCRKLEHEAGLYREAYRAGGKLGPEAFYAVLGKAVMRVRELDYAIAKAREKEAKGVVELERLE